MPKGLPRELIKKNGVSKKAWRIFKAGTRTRKTERGKSMARKFKKRHSKPSFTLPLAAIAGFIPVAAMTYNRFTTEGPLGASDELVARLTGYKWFNKTWNIQYLIEGLGPILVGFLVHWGVSKMGINRALGRAKVPILRI
jgi:hypothetical protein